MSLGKSSISINGPSKNHGELLVITRGQGRWNCPWSQGHQRYCQVPEGPEGPEGVRALTKFKQAVHISTPPEIGDMCFTTINALVEGNI